ncbi:MAG: PP2C family serine/threonine-protein phosphatase [Patescibacteria group bacterium]
MVEFVFLSEKGKRENNEDFYGNVGDEFFVVCDGVGGYAAGEVASKIAVEKALESFRKLKGKKVGLEEIFKAANKEVLQSAEKNPEWVGMGTTFVVGVLQSNEVVIGNVGDSRAYIFSGGTLRQISKDDRDTTGFLTGALGIDAEAYPHISKTKIQGGALILLCTDGLTDFVQEKVIEKILASEADLKNKAQNLIDAALQFGSTDNITVGLINVWKLKNRN